MEGALDAAVEGWDWLDEANCAERLEGGVLRALCMVRHCIDSMQFDLATYPVHVYWCAVRC